MSFSGGVFSINTTGQPVVSGTTISASVFNALTADLATGLSTCMLKDGTQTATAGIGFYAGTVSLPGIYFGTDTATGLYRIGLNNTGYSINGTKLLDLSSAVLGLTGAFNVSGLITSTVSGRVLYNATPTTGNNYIQLANTGGNVFFGKESSAGGSLIGATAAYAIVIGQDSNYPIQFGTNNTLQATIQTAAAGTPVMSIGGALKFTTNNYIAATDVSIGPDGGGGIYINVPTGKSVNLGINGATAALTANSDSSVSIPYVWANTGGTTAVLVDSAGKLWKQASSRQYKTDFSEYSKGIDDILKLKPTYYRLKNQGKDGQIYAGFIAEDFDDQGLSEFVGYSPSGPDSINYGFMAALFANGFKNHESRLAALEKKIGV